MIVDIRLNKVEDDNNEQIRFEYKGMNVITTPMPDDIDEFIKWGSVGAYRVIHKEDGALECFGVALHSLIFNDTPALLKDVMKENSKAIPWNKRCFLNRIYATIPIVAKTLAEKQEK